jgi:hypothetical protein
MELITRTLPSLLSDEQRNAYGQEQAKLLVEIKSLEADRTEANRRIKPKRTRVNYLAPVIDSGMEHKEVECYWEYHWEQGVKNLRRHDTDEIVEDTVPIEDYESQMNL